MFSESTVEFKLDCAYKCVNDIFCAGYAFKEKQQNEKPNCQLTNTLDHNIHEKVCSRNDKGWNFYHPVGPSEVKKMLMSFPFFKCSTFVFN